MVVRRLPWQRNIGKVGLFLCQSVNVAIGSAPALEPVVLKNGEGLSAPDIDKFWRQGFLWIRGFATTGEVGDLKLSMSAMIDDWETLGKDSKSNSSLSSLRGYDDGSKTAGHQFLLESATRASFFLESRDRNGSTSSGEKTKRSVVRKVGHGLHLVQGPTRDFVHSQKVADLVAALGWQQAVIAQTLHRLTPPLAAGVDRHQDSTTLYTEPPSCLGILLALEDASLSNGCLFVRNGSHNEPIRERLVRDEVSNQSPDQVGLIFRRLANASQAPDSAFWPVEVSSGDAIVTHGALEHFSIPGVDPERSRQSLQVHVIEASAKWSPLNWLQYPPGMSFEPLGSAHAPSSGSRRQEL